MLGVARVGFIALAFAAAPIAAQYEIQKPGEIQQPKGNWQKPGEIQQPKGTWQQPGEIQVPKGIQAIKTEDAKCAKRFLVGADALFAFDQATLTPDAEVTLKALLPLLASSGKHPASVEGHTDSKGDDAYNQSLSERRAQTVKSWLASHGALAAATSIQGWGERRPVAPNAKPDGSDDPVGRQKNRRVEVVLDLCKAGG
jgi:outer membrane protein OmpA-like peptidoglycan-associated protein